ncbi:type II secretion system F family protein [Adhaeretor mobilis]|uniref:Type II secretion system protein F n=1 Tax=Adhaeretor mobilis TaxID=1930276 RepID=A0A517N0Y8_9BACT|nr:type II secretion system F family protein [Adhaeretor mobilis]QDT00793.1 Type II secretion system protein F [Adhaeretor mobilis]
MSELFPTFARFFGRSDLPAWPWSRWTSTPWWPADTLASKQQGLLRILSAGLAERLELAPLVESFAKEHRGRYRRRLYRLAQRLNTGTPLPDALEQTPGTLSDEQSLAVRFGMQSGTIAEVFDGLTDQSDQTIRQVGHRLRQIGAYMTLLGVFLLLVLSFLVVKIFPQFHAILRDFYLEGTESFHLLNRIANLAIQLTPLLIVVLLLGVWLTRAKWPRRFFRRHVVTRLFKPIRQLRSGSLLNLLAIAHQAGRPLPGTLSTLARYHYDSWVRQRLLFVRNEVEQGANLWQSLATARLLSPAESRALQHTTTTDSTVWTLRHLADWKESRVAQRLDAYLDALLPCVVLLMAAAVLFVALATMTPLYQLIEMLG